MPDKAKTIPEMSIEELEQLIEMIPRLIANLPEPLRKIGADFLMAHGDRAHEELKKLRRRELP